MRPLVALVLPLLTACGMLPTLGDSPAPVVSPELERALQQEAAVVPADGAIWRSGQAQALALFEDQRARRVGDLLTVLLVEKTDAQKKANTSTSRDTSVNVDNPVLFGRPLTVGGTPILDIGLGAGSEFAGAGSSNQSNKLEGSLSVMVVRVLPNGSLVIRGDKQLALNQGSETVAVEGVVRPQDIRADNSVTSDRIANARLSYEGSGAVADANAQGWLARFFNSALWPF